MPRALRKTSPPPDRFDGQHAIALSALRTLLTPEQDRDLLELLRDAYRVIGRTPGLSLSVAMATNPRREGW